MAFPQSVLGVKTELNINGAWTDVSSKVYQRDGMHITRGLMSEGSTASPQTCSFTLNNRTGDFSPRNPVGAYYGYIGRNTQMRVSVPAASSWMPMPLGTVASATTPDKAALDITGDIDLRADLWSQTWRHNYSFELVSKYNVAGNQVSYALVMSTGGYLRMYWSTDGSTFSSARSTSQIPAPISGRKAVRATLQVNNGAGGYTVTFYVSDTIAGTWTQLGDVVIGVGVTSIFSGSASLAVGDTNQNLGNTLPNVKMYAVKVLNGIGGTEVANPDFTAQTNGATSFTDAAGNVWTLNSTAISARNYRFYGEISEWPPNRDVSDKDRVVQVTASGILRRLGRGTKPLQSPYRRACTSTASPVASLVAYWPCEDSAGSTLIASAFPNQPPMIISGTPTLASDSTTFVCSAALPVMNTGSFTGAVPAYTSTGQIQVRCFVSIPSTGTTSGSTVLSIRCGGTAVRWDIVYTSVGTLTLNAYDNTGTLVGTSGGMFGGLDGFPFRLGLQLSQSGSNVVWAVEELGPGYPAGGSGTGTINNVTIGAVTQVSLAPSGNLTGVVMGQCTVQSAVTSLYDLYNQFNAYVGETVSSRFQRLCSEESIPYAYTGADTTTEITMGAQSEKTLLDLLRECETADGGILYEPRDFFGVIYRSGRSLESQAATVTLNYAAADMSMPFAPTEDDRYITNDVTVSRTGGSSARYADSTSPLSTQAPPAGVGLYDSTVTLANALDSDLPGRASWRVHLGTVNEPRFTNIAVQLARSNFTGSATKTAGAQAVDVGDRLVITNPPSDLPPDNINQLAIGMVETLNAFVWDISWIGQPEDPYHVPTYTDGVSRYASGTSTLNGAHNSTTTSLSVASTGALWGHGDGNYDILVGGERMTVTAVSGTSSPQTLTVTRSVNGIVKSHSSGETVELFNVTYYAL